MPSFVIIRLGISFYFLRWRDVGRGWEILLPLIIWLAGVTKHRNGAEWTGMRWNGPEWTGMTPEWTGMKTEWTGMDRNEPEWHRNEPEWTGMDRNGPEWTEMNRNDTGMNRNEPEWTGMDRNALEWHRNDTGINRNYTGMNWNDTGISFFCKKSLLLVNVLICVPKLKVFKSIFSYACFIIICCWSGGLIRFATIFISQSPIPPPPPPPPCKVDVVRKKREHYSCKVVVVLAKLTLFVLSCRRSLHKVLYKERRKLAS